MHAIKTNYRASECHVNALPVPSVSHELINPSCPCLLQRSINLVLYIKVNRSYFQYILFHSLQSSKRLWQNIQNDLHRPQPYSRNTSPRFPNEYIPDQRNSHALET